MHDTDFESIKNNLENGTPFCFVKLNDGEISAILNINSPISRGDQQYNEEMSEKLRDALLFANEENNGNYFAGLPCKNCYPQYYNSAIGILGENNATSKQLVNANLLINSNFNRTYDLLDKTLKNTEKTIVFVCNKKAKVENLNFIPSIILKVPEKNSWDYYKNYKEAYSIIPENSIVLFCCGPLGRVLAYEWYKNRRDLTCIELGSFYDPWTLGKAYMYHTGLLYICGGCNPEKATPINDELIKSCTHREQYYYTTYSLNLVGRIYLRDIELRQYYYISYLNSSDENLRYYLEYLYTIYDLKVNKKEQFAASQLEIFLEKYPNRVEGPYEFIRQFITNPNKKIYYLNKLKDIPIPTNVTTYKEFVEESLYKYQILFDIVKEYKNIENYNESYTNWLELMKNKNNVPKELQPELLEIGDQLKTILEANGNLPAHDYRDVNGYYTEFLRQLKEVSKTLPPTTNDTIPKYFHFIFITGNYEYCMSDYLAIKTCYSVEKPDRIFMWYDDTDKNIDDNRWWNLSKKYATFIKVTNPTHVNLNYIWAKQHRADLMRVNILYEIGGIYADTDILFISPLNCSEKQPLFEKDNNKEVFDLYQKDFVMCRECEDKIGNCVIMTKKGHPMLKEWIRGYELEYGTHEDWWGALSVRRPHELSLKHPEWNITILQTEVFLPFIYCDPSPFRELNPEKVKNSLVIHLWATESRKYNWLPENENYFIEYPNTLFTSVFAKYM